MSACLPEAVNCPHVQNSLACCDCDPSSFLSKYSSRVKVFMTLSKTPKPWQIVDLLIYLFIDLSID